MKKTVLALSLSALFASTAIQAADIFKTEDGSANFYGQLRTQVEKYQDKDATLNAGSSRAGVSAQYAVNDQFDVLGKVEFGVSYKDGDKYAMENRLHYFGISGDFGTVTFGRQWVVADDAYGAEYSYFFGGSALLYSTMSGARHDSLIKYVFENDNIWVGANYGLGEDNSQSELAELYAKSQIAGVDVTAGLGRTSDPDVEYKDGADVVNSEVDHTYYSVTLGKGFGDFYLGATYAADKLSADASKLDIDRQGVSVAGTWAWAENATAYAGFEYSINKADTVDGSVKGKNAYVGSDYHFNDWFRVYGEMGWSDGSTLGFANKSSNVAVSPTVVDSESKFALGARVYW
ncbi:porin [Parasalinivibrio latis]|uniref:porin n=1 Tax=Parasalinivibrio latis TaxID=2952610 RepID=UPI0030DF3D5A